jgi:hypothetical protein
MTFRLKKLTIQQKQFSAHSHKMQMAISQLLSFNSTLCMKQGSSRIQETSTGLPENGESFLNCGRFARPVRRVTFQDQQGIQPKRNR